VEFIHPVRKEPIKIVAPVPVGDALWSFFEESQA
jgi:23S rRNA pseudouridine1911/1915/1917 synthase